MAALFHFSSEDFRVPPISARFSSWLDWSDTASAVCTFTLPENDPETAGMVYLLDSGSPLPMGLPSAASIHHLLDTNSYLSANCTRPNPPPQVPTPTPRHQTPKTTQPKPAQQSRNQQGRRPNPRLASTLTPARRQARLACASVVAGGKFHACHRPCTRIPKRNAPN